MKIIGAAIAGLMAQVDEKRYLRLESPQIGFTWYVHSESGWLVVPEVDSGVLLGCPSLEDAFQKELNK